MIHHENSEMGAVLNHITPCPLKRLKRQDVDVIHRVNYGKLSGVIILPPS